jgi:hypothetical protein
VPVADVLHLVTAVVVLATAVTAWRTSRRVAEVGTQVAEVHVLVNSQLSSVLDRVDQLKQVLADSGVSVPPARPIKEGPP